MIRVSALPYLNTVPFVYGLKQKCMDKYIRLSYATPAETAQQLQHNQCDLAIVPVACVPYLSHYEIIGKHCIGAVSKVASVLLCSRMPVAQIKEIALDQESRTSVQLVQLLLRDYWHVTPSFVPLPVDFPDRCPENKVLIGDRALQYGGRSPYIYDLAEHWIQWTGKPFVFALWIANKKLPDGFADMFDQALVYGLAHIDEAIDDLKDNRFSKDFSKEYLTKNISFSLDQAKQEGLQLFWNRVKNFGTFFVG